MKHIFKNIIYSFLVVLVSTAVTVAVVKAGSLTPSTSPTTATGYTLADIYTRLTTNATAVAGSFSMDPATSPGSTLYTLEQIYDAIPTIMANTVKLGTTYLGVSGTLVPSGGTATTADVCSAKTFFGASQIDWNTQTGILAIDASKVLSTATYCGITGSITNGNNITGSNASLSITIPDGYYSGNKTATAVDSNLIAGNIKANTTIFGVTGNLSATSGVTKTGQTTVYATNDDGTYQSGLAQTYTDVTVNSLKVAVNDASTGLMWQKCSAGLSGDTCATGSAVTKTFTNAILYCEQLHLCVDGTFQGSESGEGSCASNGGDLYTNWRLPNVNELYLISLKESGAITGVKLSGAPYINQTYFPATLSNSYCSATTIPGATTSIFRVHFGDALLYSGAKANTNFVRCVR